jgi:hypothetical protein
MAEPEKVIDNIWEVYAEIGASERHFNNLEHQYRLLASTWLLATFVAMGYVLINLEVSKGDWLSPHRDLVIAGIALLGAIGIRLIWILDVRVYHQLLDACFVEGLRLEHKNDWLPSVRLNMYLTQRGGTVTPNIAIFYVGCTTVLLLIAGFFLAVWLDQLVQHPASWGILLVVLGFILIWDLSIYRKSLENKIYEAESLEILLDK